MPNWCYNTLTIQGPKEEIDYIKDRLNRPFTLAQETYGMGDISTMGFPTKIEQVTYSNPVFAFFNFGREPMSINISHTISLLR